MKKSASDLSPAIFRRALLGWFRRAGRHDLPWRRNWDPYPVLVSELMLQQTTVAAVIPYFHRFLKTFPTFKSLASAPLEKVLERWSGLGYYARARNLQKAAQKIVAEHAGRMPSTREAVEDLPGVGPYTAGAVLSFAFNQPAALVDGNVIRVLARVDGIRRNPKEPKILAKIWRLARALVPSEGGREFNSALMDLGATVCRPASPDCPACPLARMCVARRKGWQDRIPATGPETAKRRVHVAAAVIEKEGRWWLMCRPADGLYGGLWEFPGVETAEKAAPRQAAALLSKKLGVPLRAEESLPSSIHILTHREMHVHPVRYGFEGALQGGIWATAREIDAMAVSSLTRRVLAGVKRKEKVLA